MKAAVINSDNATLQCVDVPEPNIRHDNEVLVSVKAVALKHLDKSIAQKKHYSSDTNSGTRIIGGDGICILPDGTRVYGMGIGGMLAEKAIIRKDRIVPVPDGLDDALAAALPNAVIGAAMALKFKADVQEGDVVLVNGATGVTGRMAVQLAKYYGAKKVIATGRDPQSLAELLKMGADKTIRVLQDDEHFTAQLAAMHSADPVDVVIDYLWGHTAELILSVLKGDGSFSNRIRYVSVGSMAGDLVQLSSAVLRSVNLQLTGSGMGSWSKEQVSFALKEILPETFRLAAEGKLKMKTITGKLDKIADLWDLPVPSGTRVVVTVS